ncbi:MAG: gamma-glutamylcyclotransferase family protein [Saprospiraceae bacterium]
MSSLLFVYGSLLSNVPSVQSRNLHQQASLVASVRVPGKLYNLGYYPGFVYDPNATTWVKGEVLDISGASSDLLEILDEYEGVHLPHSEYERRLIPIDAFPEVWAYIFIQPTDALLPIPSEDYADWYLSQPAHIAFVRNGRTV